MRKIFLLLICFVAAIDLNAQSAEILSILKEDKLYSAEEMDNHIASLKPYVGRRETNENEYASMIMRDANRLETQARKGIYNARKLKVKLNEAGKSYWVSEIDDLIDNFTTIKTKSALVKDNAHSLYYLNHKRETVIQYYNEMVSAIHSILSNANYARQSYKTVEEIFRWELTYESKEDKNKRIQQEIEETRRIVNLYKQSNNDKPKMGCLEGDCENGYGVYVSESGMKRQGMFKKKQLTGVGRIDSERGYYIGEFLDGYFNGFGIRIYKNGDKYMGSWQKGNKHGIGVFIKNDGSVLKGFFKNNALTSEYVITYTVYNFIDKTKKGCISGDCVNGYGNYIFPTGGLYIGTWKNGIMHGNGYYHSKSGKVYCGEFKEGKYDGFGSLMTSIDVNLECYIGYWKNDLKEGNGTYIFREGTFSKGVWIKGKYQ